MRNSNEHLSGEEWDRLENTRDHFQSLKEKIRDGIIETNKFAVNRYANWRMGIANISFAVAIAIVPLMFFTGKEPQYPDTFFLAVVLLFANGFIALNKEKQDVEVDLHAIGHLGKKELFDISAIVHSLNKVLLNSKRSDLRNYLRESNRILKEADTLAIKSSKDKVSIWNELHLLIPIFAVYLLSREVILVGTNEFFFIGLIVLGLLGGVYIRIEYSKAVKANQVAAEWDGKLKKMEQNNTREADDIVRKHI